MLQRSLQTHSLILPMRRPLLHSTKPLNRRRLDCNNSMRQLLVSKQLPTFQQRILVMSRLCTTSKVKRPRTYLSESAISSKSLARKMNSGGEVLLVVAPESSLKTTASLSTQPVYESALFVQTIMIAMMLNTNRIAIVL